MSTKSHVASHGTYPTNGEGFDSTHASNKIPPPLICATCATQTHRTQSTTLLRQCASHQAHVPDAPLLSSHISTGNFSSLPTPRHHMASPSNEEWVLASYPDGPPQPHNFRKQACPMPVPGPSQVLVKTLCLSVGKLSFPSTFPSRQPITTLSDP